MPRSEIPIAGGRETAGRVVSRPNLRVGPLERAAWQESCPLLDAIVPSMSDLSDRSGPSAAIFGKADCRVTWGGEKQACLSPRTHTQ